MNTKKHNWILYLISITILATIVVQFYWNYKNYEENKQRVLNEIQVSLDNSIEQYFSELSKKNFFTIVEPKGSLDKNRLERRKAIKDIFAPLKKKIGKINSDSTKFSFQVNSIEINSDKNLNSTNVDSILKNVKFNSNQIDIKKDERLNGNFERVTIKNTANTSDLRVFTGRQSRDSLKLIKGLQTIFIAIQNDSIDYKNVDSILKKGLKNKGIISDFYFKHTKEDTLFYSNVVQNVDGYLTIEASSTFLKPKENFSLIFSNPTIEALKRSSFGIFLSLLLSSAVILSLVYLLKIINHQKQLAEIKNDLISNITHEFKTPIATVSTAIEAIENFNVIDDKEKTKKYLSMSSIQLKKLHQMVEKLLETATLDSEKLMLKSEKTEIVSLIDKIAKKHQHLATEKSIVFSSNLKSIEIEIDVFHFENAISNLIDNAIKYGGDKIEVNINSVLNVIEISVVDNGNGIDKNQQEKIFDKFYRVPKGNTHDVKGFGIGLYYTKKIIEKHNGSIAIIPNAKNTIFKTTLPNG